MPRRRKSNGSAQKHCRENKKRNLRNKKLIGKSKLSKEELIRRSRINKKVVKEQ